MNKCDEFEKYFFGNPTICVDCDKIVLKTHSGLKSRAEVGNETVNNIWYNLYCGARKRETGIDFVTGHLGYVAINDLGNKAIVEEPYQYCRGINTEGSCPDYIKSDIPIKLK